MSQSPPPTRVSGGPPMWLWFLLSFITIAVVVGVVVSSVPEDPQAIFDSLQDEITDAEDVKLVKEQLKQLNAFDDYNVHVTFLEARVAILENRDPRALKLLEKIPAGHELKAESLKLMGDVYRRINKFEESMKSYEQSVAAAPDTSTEVRVALAKMYAGIGAQTLAETTLNAALELDPDLESAYETLALIKVAQGRFDEAVEDFEKILSTPGQFSAASPSTLSFYGSTIVKAKKTALIEEAVDEYLELFEEASQRMELLIAAGRIDEAMEEVGEGAGIDAQTAVAKRFVALCSLRRKDWKQAETEIRPLLDQSPREIRLFEMAVELYTETENGEMLAVVEENLKQLEEIQSQILSTLQKIGNDIDDAEGRLELGRLYLEAGQYQQASRWHALAAMIDDQYQVEANDVLSGIGFPRTPLVPFPSSDEKDTKDTKEADETKADETKADETKADDTKADEAKADDTKADDTKADDTKADEAKADDTKADDTKAE